MTGRIAIDMDGHAERPVEKKSGYRPDEDMFRFLVENSGDILWTIDLTGRWQFITSNVEKAIHVPVKDIIGKYVWDFVAPEYREILKNKLQRRMAGEDIPAYEVMVLDKYGRRVPFEVKTSPILDKQGKIIGIQGISRDITLRKKTEEALRKSEEALKKAYGELERRVEERTRDLAQARSTLQGILNTAPIGIVVANSPDGNITFYSPGAEKIFGDEVTGNAYRPIVAGNRMLGPDGLPFSPDKLPLTISLREGRRIAGVEMQYLKRGGERRDLLVSSAPIRDENGRISAAVAAIVDITRLKYTENELRDAKAQAELYLDLMSHDINNMNMMALGYIDMARLRTTADEETNTMLDKSADMLKSSSELIDNVRKLRQAELGKLQREQVDLCGIIDSVRNKYSGVPGRNVDINVVYHNQRACLVKANQLLDDVFANLIGNSIKHALPDRHLTIDIVLSGVCEDGREYYRIAIEDNGPGITDELKGKLFTRLQRGKTKTAGRGLGLYLVKALVKDFGGKIWVEDRVPGNYREGARFVVLLPAARPEPEAGTGTCAG